MILSRDQLDAFYEQLKLDSTSGAGGCTIIIFVAPSCDAICATRILTFLLRSDAIPYLVKPVANYDMVREADEELLSNNTDVRSVVMINCGAVVNILSLLPNLPEQARVYIADSHRPVHLANIYRGDTKVFVLDDGSLLAGEEELPEDGEGLSGDEGLDSSDDEEEDDDEDEDEDSEGEGEGQAELDSDNAQIRDPRQGRRRRRRTSSGASDSESDDEEDGGEGGEGDGAGLNSSDEEIAIEQNSDSDASNQAGAGKQQTAGAEGGGGADGGSTKRGRKRRFSTGASTMRRERQQRKELLQQYYSGVSHALGASPLLFDMATQMNMDTNELLWLAIVGLTDQYLSRKMDPDSYVLYVQHFRSHVLNKNADEARDITASDGTLIPVSESGRICYELEYRFMLHRHWSLYDAMFYSSYVACKLSVWTGNGRHRLEELLAKMGLSLHQCQQKYPFMSSQLRSRLRAQIERYGEEYGLDDVFYGSFTRSMGFKTDMSAADVVYSVTALMERVGEGEGEAAAGQAGGGAEEDVGEAWLDSFNDAYDALAGKSPQVIKKGLELSMGLQKGVVMQAISMVQKGSLTPAKHFRYGYIHATEADNKLFTQPMALLKLAHFLVDMHRENGKWTGAKARPLVILCERPNTYLVVGVPCAERVDEVLKNRFGTYFRLASEESSARVRHSGFEGAVTEVMRDDVQKFIHSLHHIMDA